ncbi:MAG: GMC oxidoreductase [Steroidobacteraceae bacterium]
MDFDAIVIGSGFGGSVTAFRLANAGLRVCLLERGRPFPPGSFPRSPHDLAANFWDPDRGLHGMFDVWSFSSLEAVVSSGLGGGSLIYANVMLRKPETWFVHDKPDGSYENWPVTREDLDPHYDSVEKMIGTQTYPIDKDPYRSTAKTFALLESARKLGLESELVPLAITFANAGQPAIPGVPIVGGENNLHRAPRYTCRLVGECDIGCQFGSKNSLDFTYLSAAERRGAEIRTNSEVHSFERTDSGFSVTYTRYPDSQGESDSLAGRQRRTITAHRLVLSAGALGTSYLLLRNRSAFPALSPALGRRFCGNGDFLGLVFGAKQQSDGIRVPRILDPSLGPVITAAMLMPDKLDGGQGRGFYIEDAGYPQFVNWLVDDNIVTAAQRGLRFLLRRAWSYITHSAKSEVGRQVSNALSKGLFTATSMPLLGMGREVPNGRLSLRDGNLDLDWDPAASHSYFTRLNDTMRRIATELNGTYASDPLWWLNLLITVHPVGGAPMGRHPAEGVVNEFGQVFGYDGLSIADGSVLPGPVGTNPSLTIAAMADRSADWIIHDFANKRSATHVI